MALISTAGCSASSGAVNPATGSSATSAAQQLSISVTGNTTVRLGTTSQFTATVTGVTGAVVSWMVDGTVGGGSVYGTISTTGLYTPPATIPSGAVTVSGSVTSAGTTSGSTLRMVLQNPIPVVSSATATQVGTSQNFLIDVKGTGFLATSVLTVNTTSQTTTFVSATELQATFAVPTGTTTLAVTVSNPDPGAIVSSATNVAVTPASAATLAAAARLLDQSSFGPTATTINHVQQIGLGPYITEQFAQPTTTLAQIPVNPLPALCLTSNTAYPCAESEWWTAAITGPDQLRQRVAFALSEMFVVSTQSVPGQSIPSFHNILANDAFGNFLTMMKDVSLSPAMGAYLNMLNSAKPATGQIANENYSRELMQLFTLGLYQLNQDGTPQLDASGNMIPAYTQAQVQAFARAYTGWTLANTAGGAVTKLSQQLRRLERPDGRCGEVPRHHAEGSAQHDTASRRHLSAGS